MTAASTNPTSVAEVLDRALRQIILVRPIGDVDTCKNPRAIIKQIERIAVDALDIANASGLRSAAESARAQVQA